MRDKHFPTVIGVILLMVILFSGVYLSQRTTSLSSKASSSCEPINPQINNLTYGSFDFSFTTSTSCLATLKINDKIFKDSSTVFNTHYFKVTNLSPNTSYQFSLISGNTTYSRPEFSLVTATKPSSSIPTSNLAWGRIVDSNIEPVSGAIIYLLIPGSQALSAFSNKDGNWNISFATSFNESKTDWFNPTSPLDEDIIVYSPDGKLTQLSNRTDNNDPVPDIIVGQNYFSTTSTTTTSSLLDSTATQSTVSLSLTSPQESESISSLRPDIFGNGPAGAIFQLKLDGFSHNVTVASNNIWHWSPSQDLSLGSHQLVLTYQDTTITRNFTVASDDNYLAFSSTPSATIAPTIVPTEIPSPTPTLVVRTAKVSTTSSLLKSGATLPTFALIIASVALFGISLFYYQN